MEAFSDWVAREKWACDKSPTPLDWHSYITAWRTLRDLFACKTFVPREPVVVHGPLPDKLPKFPHIIPERKEPER